MFSIFLLRKVSAVLLDVTSAPGAARTADSAEQNTKLVELYGLITEGASSFLNAEYRLCALFVVGIRLLYTPTFLRSTVSLFHLLCPPRLLLNLSFTNYPS